jgi:two-component system sensor histidine kinase/response regulator
MDLDNIPLFIIKTDLQGNILYLNSHIKKQEKFNGIEEYKNVLEFINLGANNLQHNIKDHTTIIYLKETNKIEVNINTYIQKNEIIFFMDGLYKYYEIKNNFMSNFGHEIRSPLHSILGVISLIEDTKLDKEQVTYLEILKESSNNLMNMADNILDYTKLETGNLQLNIGSFYFRDCIETVHSMMSIQSTEKVITMTYNINKNITDFIISDYIRLQQILINLYNNSIKFTKTKGTIHTDIDCKELNETSYKLMFTIHDSGSPDFIIKKEDYQNIFKSYYQLFTNFNDRNNEGTGLGLAICKELTLIMKGNINVISSNTTGTKMQFYITVEKSFEHTGPVDITVFKDKKVLVVDDALNNRTMLCSLLRKSGMIPFPVSTSDEALIMIKNNIDFDVALLDIYLPRFTGVRLAEHIGILKPTLPLIALSSLGDKTNNMGTNLFHYLLVKPVKEIKLLAVIQSVLTTNKQKMLHEDIPLDEEQIKILINDDDKYNRQILRKQLEKLGHKYIIEVENGQECIDILHIKYFDLIFIDINTPIGGKNGYDVIKFIKNKNIKSYSICLSGIEINDPNLFNDTLLKPLQIYKLKEIMKKFYLYKKI